MGRRGDNVTPPFLIHTRMRKRQYCNLGDYEGLYVIVQRPEIDKHIVDTVSGFRCSV